MARDTVRTIALDPRVYAITVPMGTIGLSTSTCYVVKSGKEALLVDTGVGTRASWKALLAALHGLAVAPERTKVVLTHNHFDHSGNARRLTAAGYKLHLGKSQLSENAWHAPGVTDSLVEQRFTQEGFRPIFRLSKLRASLNLLPSQMLPTGQTQGSAQASGLLAEYSEGSPIRVGSELLEVVRTQGHSHSDLSFFLRRRGLLFSGDIVLDKINPGLAFPLTGESPLETYLQSLGKVKALDARLLLPGHWGEIANPQAAIDRISAHHARKLGFLYEAIANAPGITGRDAIRGIQRDKSRSGLEALEAVKYTATVANGLCYLEYLVNMGEIERTQVGGINRYRAL